MPIDIRLPNIDGKTDSAKIEQIKSYLYQFTEQLKWAMLTLEKSEKGESSENVVIKDTEGNEISKAEASAQSTFNSIKDIIIKSADIVEAYYEKIDNLIDLSGKYTAEATFPGGSAKYIEDTNMSISATSKYVEQKFTKTEVIDGEEVITGEYSLSDLDKRIRKQEGSIRYGEVDTTLTEDGKTIGIEVGEIDTINDVVISRYATFSAAGIELYDGTTDSLPVATISKTKITITSAEFITAVKMGKYRLDFTKGIAFKWEGA